MATGQDGDAEQDPPARDGVPRARPADSGPLPLLRSPLAIGGVAIGLMVWMVIVILLLIAWRLTSG